MLSQSMINLCDKLSCVDYRGDQHTDVLIKETDDQAKLKSITLNTTNGDWISFSPDKGRGKQAKMSQLLAISPSLNHHCACDNVILVMQNNKLTILYIDLKSDSAKGYANQFKSVRQFMRYLLGLLEEFCSIKLAIQDERYIVFHTNTKQLINKKTTVPHLYKLKNTKPDNAYKREVINGGHMYLKELLET